jgi:hypothetical protein
MDQAADSLDWMEARIREGASQTGFHGLDLQRGDGYLIVTNSFTQEQQEAWRKEAAKRRKAVQFTMLEIVDQLDRDLRSFDPLDTIAHAMWMNSLHNAEDWNEHQFEGNDVFTEYVALLCLTHAYEEYEEPSLEASLSFDGIAIQNSVRNLFQLSALEDELEQVESEAPPTTEQELRFLTLLHEVGVRYPGSSEHLHEVVGGLFAPMSDDFSARLGFSVEEALRLDRGIYSLINKRLSERILKATAFARSLMRAVKRFRQKGKVDAEYSEELLRELAALRPSEAADRIKKLAAGWVFLGFGQTMAFTASELAESAGVGAESAQAFLDFHSLEFGGVSEFFRLPRPTHPLQTSPIICFRQDGDAKFLCPVFQAVGWAIRPSLEEWLKGGEAAELTALREKYEARKSEYLEEKAFKLLSDLLKPADGFAHQGAKYRKVVDGEEQVLEVDGIFILGNVLVLLEAKSGGVRPSARRGGLYSMRADLEALLGKASQQTAGAWKYLSSSEQPVLELASGSSWTVPMKGVNRVFRVCVTLEDLTVFATNIHSIEAIGLVDLDTPFWAVSIYDLLVLRDLIDLPAVFIHYLASRFSVEKLGCVHGYCELDHLACYLLGQIPYGPYGGLPDDLSDNTSIILDPSYSSLIDNWYFYLQGYRKSKPQKPERNLPPAFRKLLESLQAKRPPHYLEMSCLLFDLPDVVQGYLAETLNELAKRTNQDKRRHDFSLAPPGGNLGITLLTTYEDAVEALAERLGTYCRAKKHQLRKDYWIGIGSISWAEEPIQLALLLDEPWKPDSDLDKLVAKLLPPMDKGE